MSGSSKKYWKGIEELENHPEFVKNANKEFQDYLPVLNKNEETGATHRRDFLKILGFGVAAVSLAACEAPVKKAIPYAIKPEEVDPGVANWYASTFVDGADYCSVLVKTREGRPVKIEGNKFSSINNGGTTIKAQASVLSLYDEYRLTKPQKGGKDSDWKTVDAEISASLNDINSKGGKVRLVTSSIASPSTQAVIAQFLSKNTNAKQVVYDSISYAGIVKANLSSFGKAAVPTYDFSKASVIVSIGADFLSTWLLSAQYAKQYAKTRKLSNTKKEMSRHYQFETNLSLTGANADFRTPVKPSQLGLVATSLFNAIGGSVSAPALELPSIKKAATDLLKAKNEGKSTLVVSGSNDPNVQVIVNAINTALGNYGSTVDISKTNNLVQGNDSDFNSFVDELKAGELDAVLFYNVNPVYTSSRASEIKEGIKKTPLTISFAPNVDETSNEVKYILPDNHYLESWNDFEPITGKFSFQQPTITNIFDTRQFQDTLLKLSGSNASFYDVIRNTWASKSTGSFEDFWNRAVHNGVYETSIESMSSIFSGDVNTAASNISSTYKANSGKVELSIYVKAAMGDGSQANNPWLQEVPDPITKATWDNYITISPKDAKEKGITNVQGNTVYGTLKIGNKTTEKLPILIQPGQAIGTFGVALGYGRVISGKVAKEGNKSDGKGIGVNAFEYTSLSNSTVCYSAEDVSLTVTSELRQIAHTQIHQTIMGRNIVQDTTLKKYIEKPNVREHNETYEKTIVTPNGKERADQVSMWTAADWKSKYNNHFWGMVIDLNSCIGCSSCVVSCNAENNVPVVGRDEISNARDMHWMRIDRYYSSVEDSKPLEDRDKRLMENPEDNPQVVFQPMMCQHCNNAPCETVCPVLATTHSTEGLNQMTYNRCVGTRYCANNCPYKVRRFNWFAYTENEMFDFHMNSKLGKMVLNPDVTVRARGVMEKCSMCVQRIQEGKLNAKKESRRPIDGEIETACSQSCPTDAITFGDMNDSESKISKLIAEESEGRLYQVLEEINTRPSIYYLSKVRNID
ncbi:MAG: TAT-variant-translocated molybdopterin oxidoreductase [Cytophagales bacterium]